MAEVVDEVAEGQVDVVEVQPPGRAKDLVHQWPGICGPGVGVDLQPRGLAVGLAVGGIEPRIGDPRRGDLRPRVRDGRGGRPGVERGVGKKGWSGLATGGRAAVDDDDGGVVEDVGASLAETVLSTAASSWEATGFTQRTCRPGAPVRPKMLFDGGGSSKVE